MEEEEVVVSDPDRSLSFSDSRTVCHVYAFSLSFNISIDPSMSP